MQLIQITEKTTISTPSLEKTLSKELLNQEVTPSKIAIIGAGHVGVSLLCDLSVRLNGGLDRTTLFFVGDKNNERWQSKSLFIFNDLFDDTSHLVETSAHNVKFLFDSSSESCLKQAQYIIITVPDIPYLRPRIISFLLNNIGLQEKLLILCRGGQGGIPYFSNWIRHDERLHNTHTVLIENSFYGTRVKDGEVNCKRKYKINVAILSQDKGYALRMLRDIFPPKPDSSYSSWPHFEVKSLAALLFDSVGYIIHLGVAFSESNLELTRKGEVYLHYTDGIDKSLANNLDELDKERVAIARLFGVEADTFGQIIARQYRKPLLNNFYEMMQSCRDIYKSQSFSSIDEIINSRYVNEDIPSLYTMLHLADIAGYDAPMTRQYHAKVSAQMEQFGIDGSRLRNYIDKFPDVSSPDELVLLLNHPIPHKDVIEL